MATTKITSSTFDSIVANANKPVLIDFWASWCGPCRALGPVVEQLSEDWANKIDVYKCNVDEEPELASRFHIVSIPTLILFRDGQAAHAMVGNMPAAELRSELERYV